MACRMYSKCLFLFHMCFFPLVVLRLTICILIQFCLQKAVSTQSNVRIGFNYWEYCNVTVQERSVKVFLLIWEEKINVPLSICESVFAYTTSLSQIDCCSRCLFSAVVDSRNFSNVQTITAFLSDLHVSNSITVSLIIFVALLGISLFSVLFYIY